MDTVKCNPLTLMVPQRKIRGYSAMLLPFLSDGDSQVAWDAFERLLLQTFEAGLTPAVNMDTGFANLIDDQTREQVLRQTQEVAAGRDFIAGVYVGGHPDAPFQGDAYKGAIDQVQSFGGTPILFQSYGLVSLSDDALVQAYQWLAQACDQFLFFELGTMFAPFGRIYSLEIYRQLMEIPNAIGAKHSSLRREPEWQRLQLRNELRPEFQVLTGNDLAIDMVIYGSDYLLGLSAFAPKAFALRDAYWAAGDSRFFELNDLLQYLGAYSFRQPTTAYKHSAAMFLKIRGMLDCDATHPESTLRPDSDRATLELIAADLERTMKAGRQ